MFDEKQISSLLKSARFAAEKHQHQRRKGASALPYINHPIQVAELLWDVGQVRDSNVLLAAVLHDTIEAISNGLGLPSPIWNSINC